MIGIGKGTKQLSQFLDCVKVFAFAMTFVESDGSAGETIGIQNNLSIGCRNG